ncbi:uncharacterized protein LOC133174770 [Saccostrea echinata]|uniref:uncharacterized protein LOC133174770 n=1 Tax=Saccostrea echinata TaxID=191078 RepID=UPI002A83607D|nr:uncharacterized protein LOC133174770 [Saccostrea echinata]
MEISLNTTLKVPKCSNCQVNKEYYCKTCKGNLCVLCKEKHVTDLDGKYHDVVIDCLRNEDFMIPESCERHSDRNYKYLCQSCEHPICEKCNDHHHRHKILDITIAYKTQRQQSWNRFVDIRSELLLYNHAIMAEIKSDYGKCQSALTQLQLKMTSQAQTQKTLIDIAVKDTKEIFIYLNSKFQKSRRTIKGIETYVFGFEQSTNKPVQFLSFIKRKFIPRMKGIPKTLVISLQNEMNLKEMSRLLGKVHFIETRKRRVENDRLLRLVTRPVLHNTITIPCTSCRISISFVTSDRIWVSGYGTNLFLVDSTGSILHHRTDVQNASCCSQTVSPSGELIYIDLDFNITKLCKDNETKIIFMNIFEVEKPWNIYCSSASGNLLVLMKSCDHLYFKCEEAFIMVFNRFEQLVRVIMFDIVSGQKLYNNPELITENQNGDAIVSDQIYGNYYEYSYLVVTDRKGNYRFSYYGPTIDSQLSVEPWGICTDSLSNILIAIP